MLIKVTSYLTNDDYTPGESGLMLKNRLLETDALINTDDIMYVFPSKNGEAESMIKFRNGLTLDVKETLDEITALVRLKFN